MPSHFLVLVASVVESAQFMWQLWKTVFFVAFVVAATLSDFT